VMLQIVVEVAGTVCDADCSRLHRLLVTIKIELCFVGIVSGKGC